MTEELEEYIAALKDRGRRCYGSGGGTGASENGTGRAGNACYGCGGSGGAYDAGWSAFRAF